MKILVQNVTIESPGSSFHGKICDLLMEDGIILRVEPGNSIQEKNIKIFSGNSLCVSPGWFDLRVNFREPGMELKEDLLSGMQAAQQGGFTGVLCMPSTTPPVHSKSEIDFIRNKSKDQLVDVIPAGALSHNLEGKDLSEMYDMHRSGAMAFTDDKLAIQDSGFMIRALRYVSDFGGRIMVHPEDKMVAGKGQVNESLAATGLGLQGIPALAEELMIRRDLSIAEYTGSAIHFSAISTAGSVDLIRKAKATGLKVTCDVSSAHLYLDDSSLSSFDSHFKIQPPLRSKPDVEALIRGLSDGTIDCIASDHEPQDAESKLMEFEHAAYGISSLETSFAVSRTATKNALSVSVLVEKLAINPRKFLGLEIPEIKSGVYANLTLFDPDAEWIPDPSRWFSKSKANPFFGKKLTGKAIAVFNRNKVYECI